MHDFCGVHFSCVLSCRRVFLCLQLKELNHDNINSFIGACIEPGNICYLMQCCGRGTLKVSYLALRTFKLHLHFARLEIYTFYFYNNFSKCKLILIMLLLSHSQTNCIGSLGPLCVRANRGIGPTRTLCRLLRLGSGLVLALGLGLGYGYGYG